MNERIKTLFFLVKENRVVACDSNLKDFLKALPGELANKRGYDYFYRKFKDNDYFTFEFNENYFFQKLEY